MRVRAVPLLLAMLLARGSARAGAAAEGQARASDLEARGAVCKLAVPGMDCAGCAARVKKAVKAVEGVSKVDVDLDRKEVSVAFDDERTSAKAVRAAASKASPAKLVDTKDVPPSQDGAGPASPDPAPSR